MRSDEVRRFAPLPRTVYLVKEGTFRVGTLLKINVWESACRCISIQQPITRSGRMLSDEFLIDLDYVQPVQRGIRLDFPVVASCLRPVSTPVSATMISMTCYKLQNEHSLVPENVYNFFQVEISSKTRSFADLLIFRHPLPYLPVGTFQILKHFRENWFSRKCFRIWKVPTGKMPRF